MRRFRFSAGLAALHYPAFAQFLSARFLVILALQVQSVAVAWQVYALTGKPLDLGLVGLAQFLPFVLLILPAGHVADRYDRRRILSIGFSIELICGLLLLAFAVSGLQQVWPILAVIAVHGATRAFMMPASQSLVIHLVPPSHFGNAVALNSSAFQVGMISGPALGGLLYLAGPYWAYGTAVLLLVLAVILMWRLSQQDAYTLTVAERAPMTWDGLLEGMRFVRAQPMVLGALSLDLFAVLFGGATALLPIYAGEILHVGPGGLGLLRAAPGVGAVITALLLALWPITHRVGHWMFSGVILYGTTILVFGLSESFFLSLVALFCMGAGDMFSVYIRQMLVQLATPDAIRGRVSAINAVFIGASNELGEFESGVTAAWWGSVPAVVLGGVMTLLVTFTWMRLFPVLRRLDHFPATQSSAPTSNPA